MSKSSLKKLLITILFILIIVILILVFNNINRNNHSDKVSIVKKIIKEKYDEVVYLGDNNYIYTMIKKNKYEYSVYDLNGNRLYSFDSSKKLNIVSVSKKYFITKDDKYHLCDDSFNEIKTGNNISYLSDYLINIDNNVYNPTGKLLFKNIKEIRKYYNDDYLLIDNKFINKKGKVLVVDYEIEKEYKRNNKVDFFILKKNNKYYFFFPLVNKIIGDPCDKYFEYEKDIYVVSNNKIFKIFNSGLRNEVEFDNIDELGKKYNIKLVNAVNKNKILIINKEYLSLLNTKTNKVDKILKAKSFNYKVIDKNYINIKIDNDNYIYDLNINKIIYSGKNIEDLLIFNNNYKTLKTSDNNYYLIDNDNNILYKSNEQIILSDSELILGNIDDKIIIKENNNYYNGEKIVIKNDIYFKYKTNEKIILVSKDLKNKYESKKYINHIDERIIFEDNNKLIFLNTKNNDKKYFELENYKIINNGINKKEIILSNGSNIKIINKNGEIIKFIKNKKLEEIFYNKNESNIIIITKEIHGNKKGVYIAE